MIVDSLEHRNASNSIELFISIFARICIERLYRFAIYSVLYQYLSDNDRIDADVAIAMLLQIISNWTYFKTILHLLRTILIKEFHWIELFWVYWIQLSNYVNKFNITSVLVTAKFAVKSSTSTHLRDTVKPTNCHNSKSPQRIGSWQRTPEMLWSKCGSVHLISRI